MRLIRHTDKNYFETVNALCRKADPEPLVEKTVREIIGKVRQKGDRAVREFTVKFGGPTLSSMRVSSAELAEAEAGVEEEVKKAVAIAHANVRDFARRGLRRNWSMKNRQGALVGERFDPFQRVGIYVPGGNAPLVSSAIMTVTLAAAAGVREIVAATPADPCGMVNRALLYALNFAGATEIYKIGGAQAIAAMVYGTETIAPVQKIYGPGNAYVVEAKRQVFGRVAVDLLPGPSEIFIIADSSANPAWIAADMLAQAEHGHGGAVVFATNSARLLERVEKEIQKQSVLLERQSSLHEVLHENAYGVLVRSLQNAAELANAFAPEHLTIMAKEDEKLASGIYTAGAIFLGGYSPVASGDFVAGPSHELPTGGAGKSFAGLTVDQFQRRTSLVRFDEKSLKKSLSVILALSKMEGLGAHGRSAEIRFSS